MVRNLTVASRRSNAPYNEDTIYLTCEMLDHATGEWYKQDLTVTEDTAFQRLSNWNARYDTLEAKEWSDWTVADILKNQARYGCGF